MHVEQGEQIASKQGRLDALLTTALGADAARAIAWEPPLVSQQAGFRSKAKMVAGGQSEDARLGILGPDGECVDLSDCVLHDERLTESFDPIKAFIARAAIEPYHVPSRTGELKYVLVTVAPSGELMIRFVLRSTEALARIRKHLPSLLDALPHAGVVSANILPEHKAVTEGERELLLTSRESLAMDLGAVTLHVRPQSFFQTNTGIARGLYAQVASWVDAAAPASVWDLYCGVGGFALHCIAQGRRVTGVEVSEQAIESARMSVGELAMAGVPGADDVAFVAADATAWARTQVAPDLVIVNPPRRGIGPELSALLEQSAIRTVVYSSCNAVTLAKDLEAMPSLRPVAGRLLDMFPHTEHYECVVLLERAP